VCGAALSNVAVQPTLKGDERPGNHHDGRNAIRRRGGARGRHVGGGGSNGARRCWPSAEQRGEEEERTGPSQLKQHLTPRAAQPTRTTNGSNLMGCAQSISPPPAAPAEMKISFNSSETSLPRGENSLRVFRGFITQRILGTGQVAAVYKVCRLSDKKVFAIKAVQTANMSSNMNQAFTEARQRLSFDHPNILKLIDFFVEGTDVCMLLEFAPYATLDDLIKKNPDQRLPESKMKEIMFQLVDALRYLHSRNIVHRDIRTDNGPACSTPISPLSVFVFEEDGSVVKLGDFAFAKEISDRSVDKMSMQGSPFYISPEMGSEQAYGNRTDVWSLGCLAIRCTISAGDRQKNGLETTVAVYDSARWGAVKRLWEQAGYSKGLTALLLRMLEPNSSKRPSARVLLDDPYFVDCGIERLMARKRLNGSELSAIDEHSNVIQCSDDGTSKMSAASERSTMYDVSLDASQLKWMQQALQSNTRIIVIGVQSDGVIRDWNVGAASTLGYCQKEAARHMTLLDIFQRPSMLENLRLVLPSLEDDCSVTAEELFLAMTSKSLEKAEWMMSQKSGGGLEVSLTISIIPSVGQPTVAAGILAVGNLVEREERKPELDAISDAAVQ
jgi:NIMA (never in mitosis gene a)-related kinase 1/4/5